MTFSRLTRFAVTLAILGPAASAEAATPKATCRATDAAETGLSGETTAADVASGKNVRPTNCNVDLVGGVQGEGAAWQHAAWKTCAYYNQANSPNLQNPGTVVLDVSDPAHPVVTDHLTTPTMIDPWESLKVNPARQLLAGAQDASSGFDLWDISADCRHPVLKASITIAGSFGHAGQFAPDGNTYYITSLRSSPSIVAVDTTDTSNPKPILMWTPPTDLTTVEGNPVYHDITFTKDGNTAYQTVVPSAAGGLNGLVILDVSDIQQRRANPTVRILGSVSWADGSAGAQNALPVSIGGHPYLLFTDEGGPTGFTGATVEQAKAICAQGKTFAGTPRLIDVADPAHPTIVSKLQMEVADPTNCAHMADGIPFTTLVGPGPGFGYSCHYCNVDNTDDAKIAACSCFGAGLRLFDISDPLNPKERGYYKPGAQGTQVLPGSEYYALGGAGFRRPVDWAPSLPSFPHDRGMTDGDLWTTFQDNGFAVLHLDLGTAPLPTSDAGTTTDPTPTGDDAGAGSAAAPTASPSTDDGGCNTSGGAPLLGPLVGLGFLVSGLARRRRAR